jgi:hypothetical protein
MGLDLASAGFAFRAEWYWRIAEGDGVFDPFAARACLVPVARLAAGRFVIDAIGADPIARTLELSLDGNHHIIPIVGGPARVAADHFVTALNELLAKYDVAFALVIPRRYELRGVLLPRSTLADHARDPLVLAPSDRTAWRRFARGTTG